MTAAPTLAGLSYVLLDEMTVIIMKDACKCMKFTLVTGYTGELSEYIISNPLKSHGHKPQEWH